MARGGGDDGTPAHRYRYRSRNARPENEISCFVKYMVFGFNVLFWVLGLLVLLAGVYAQVEKNPFSEIGTRLSQFYLDPAWLLVLVGGVSFLIGFSGCIGALRENTCLLAVYATFVGVLLLCELTIGVLGFVFKDWLKSQLGHQLEDMIVYYRDDPDLQSLIDWIQKDWLQCCGINTPEDWDKNIYFNKSSESRGSPEAGGVPFSCCKTTSLVMGDLDLPNYYCGFKVRFRPVNELVGIYKTGCLSMGESWVQRNLVIVGSVAVAIAVIQILGICFAQNLRSDIQTQRARVNFEQALIVVHQR